MMPTGRPGPRALVEARLVLHHAVQLASGAGSSALPARADFSHEVTTYEPAHEAWIGEVLPNGARVGLRMGDLTLLVLGGPEPGALPLAGISLDQARVWLTARTGIDPFHFPPHDRGEAFDQHPLASGASFARAEGTEELARWFAFGALRLARIASTHGGSAVRCWPHHFDIATLITVAGEGEGARTVGVGLSPGDGSYPEPYWYVSPWPYPTAPVPPKLPVGHWHTAGFFAAVLPTHETVGGELLPISEGFLHAATDAALRMVR